MTRFTAFGRALLLSVVAAWCSTVVAPRSAFAQAEKPVSDEDIVVLVDDLVAEKPNYSSAHKVRALGKRATPALVRLLNDPTRCGVVDKHRHYKTARLANVVDALSFEHAPDVVEPLTKYAQSKDPHVRSAAIEALGLVASKECIAPVLAALDDPNERIADAAMMGIHWAKKNQSYSDDFLQGIFPGLEKLARNRKWTGFGEVHRLMIAIDQGRAVKVFESPEILTVENPHVFDSLSAANKVGAKLDRDKLLAFLAVVRPIAEKGDNRYAYAAALHAYGFNPDANAEATLRTELDSKIDIVPLGAAEGLAALAGVVNPLDFVLSRYEKGMARFTPAQRHYFLATSPNGDLRNFFENERGDSWKQTLEALDAIGAVGQAKVLRQAVALFEPQTPDVDDVKRRDQLDKFSPERAKKLDELSKAYEECKPKVYVLVTLYAAAHAKEFRE